MSEEEAEAVFSENAKEMLVDLAGKISQDSNMLLLEYADFFEEIKAQLGDKLSAELLEKRALTLFKQRYRESIISVSRSSSESFTGIVLGYTDVYDKSEVSQRVIKNAFVKNPSEEFEKGTCWVVTQLEDSRYEIKGINVETKGPIRKILPLVPPEALQINENQYIIPIDTRYEFGPGNLNKSFGKPIPAHQYRRKMFVIAEKDDSHETKIGSILFKDDAAIHIKPPVYNPLKFTAMEMNKNISDPLSWNLLYIDDGSTFKTVTLKSIPDMHNFLRSQLKSVFHVLGDLERVYEKIKDANNKAFVMTEADVVNMILEPTKIGSRRMFVDDDSLNWANDQGEVIAPRLVWIPPHIDIDFGVGSRIVMCSGIKRTRMRDRDTGEYMNEEFSDIVLDAYGIWPIPEFKTAPPSKPDSFDQPYQGMW